MASELEPGQDDLVREDKASASIKRALKRDKSGVSKDDDFYTDHHAGSAKEFESKAEASTKARSLRRQDPVKGSPMDKVRGLFSSTAQMWRDAVADAERRQQQRRERRKSK